MKTSKAMRQFQQTAMQSAVYWAEKAKLDVSLQLEARRRSHQMSYKDLAEAAGVSQPYITKVFRGDANLTIESMVKFARATGSHLHIRFVDDTALTTDEGRSHIMTGYTISSSELHNDPAMALQASRHGPVIITEQDQPACVLINIEEYRRLQSVPRSLAEALAMPGNVDVEFDPPKLDIKLRDPELE